MLLSSNTVVPEVFAYVSPCTYGPLLFCNHVPCFPLYQFIFTATDELFAINMKYRLKGEVKLMMARLRMPSTERESAMDHQILKSQESSW